MRNYKTFWDKMVYTDRERAMLRLFDWQMSQLERKGLSASVLNQLKQQKKKVIKHMNNSVYYPRNSGMIYFVPVIPLKYFDSQIGTMNMAFANESNSVVFLDILEIVKVGDIYNRLSVDAQEPYFIFGLDAGLEERSVSGVSIDKAIYLFSRSVLSPLNFTEILSFLIIHDNYYKGSNIDAIPAIGSRYKQDNIVPEFIPYRDGFKILSTPLSSPEQNKTFLSALSREFF